MFDANTCTFATYCLTYFLNDQTIKSNQTIYGMNEKTKNPWHLVWVWKRCKWIAQGWHVLSLCMCELELIAHSKAVCRLVYCSVVKSKNVPVWPVKECFFTCAACGLVSVGWYSRKRDWKFTSQISFSDILYLIQYWLHYGSQAWY